MQMEIFYLALGIFIEPQSSLSDPWLSQLLPFTFLEYQPRSIYTIMTTPPTPLDTQFLIFNKDVHESDASSIFEVEYKGNRYALKVVSSEYTNPSSPKLAPLVS